MTGAMEVISVGPRREGREGRQRNKNTLWNSGASVTRVSMTGNLRAHELGGAGGCSLMGALQNSKTKINGKVLGAHVKQVMTILSRIKICYGIGMKRYEF